MGKGGEFVARQLGFARATGESPALSGFVSKESTQVRSTEHAASHPR